MPPAADPCSAPSPTPRRGNLLRGATAFGLLLACACAVLAASSRPDPPDTARTPLAPPVKLLSPDEVVELAIGDLTETLRFAGEVKPLRRVALAAEVAGLVGDVHPMTGQQVTAGDALMSIAADDYRLALALAEAELASLVAQQVTADAALRRSQSLAKRGASSDAALEQAQGAASVLEANVVAATTRLRQAMRNLERTRLYAPIPGILASRTVEPGQLVQAGDLVFEIVDLSSVLVEALVPAAQAADLHPGQTADLWTPQTPDRRIAATVARIAPQTMAGTRSVQIWLELDNRIAEWRIGTFLKGEIVLRRALRRPALPPAAIRQDAGQSQVLAIRDGTVVPVAVQTGTPWQGGKLVEVNGALRPGERVVALPLSGLTAGDAVEVAGQ